MVQINAQLDEQEREHQELLAQVAEYLISLDHSEIDAMENYLSQVDVADEVGDFLA